MRPQVAICNALGLDPLMTRRIEIDITPDSIDILVTQLIRSNDGRLSEAFRTFEVTETQPPEDDEPPYAPH